jgi:hypothetical protein
VEALEEALQSWQRQLTPNAAALMGAGRVAYHQAGVGWREEQSIVARAAARLLLDPQASRTALALAGRILAGDGGGTVDQREDVASDFRTCDGGGSEPTRATSYKSFHKHKSRRSKSEEHRENRFTHAPQ